MGTDIYSRAEVRQAGGKWKMAGAVFPLDEFGQEWEHRTHTESPFDWRSYRVFGFLADVRNYSKVPVVQEPIVKQTKDCECSAEVLEYFSDGWEWVYVISLRTLTEFDYDQIFEDLRVTRDNDGGCTGEPGKGEMTTVRDFLGERFFRDLEVLKELGGLDDVRVIFRFD